jgi:ribonuclease HI
MEGKSVYRWISHNATTNEGVGIYIQYPNEEHQSEAMHTGLHCSSYKAEREAIIHAGHTIKCNVGNNTQVVFLTDALSVLQALINENLPQLEQALYTIKTLTTVLQW